MPTQVSRRGLATLDSRLWHQLALRVHPACAIAASVNGETVIDLSGGTANPATGTKASADTLYAVWSCGKPLAASCLWLLKDRGALDWSDRVTDHWPEYGANGKRDTTIEHVLTHQAGLPTRPSIINREVIAAGPLDWAAVVAALEQAEPEFTPGSAIEYHSMNFGYLVAELVQRVSGQPFREFFREEVTGPLGLTDTYFGLPEEHERRFARLQVMPGFDSPETAALGNLRWFHEQVAPGGSGISTARDLAKFYGVLAGGGVVNGKQWLRESVINDVTSLHAEGVERGTDEMRRWGLGVQLASAKFGSQAGPRVFGHGGVGTSISWGDHDLGAGAAIVTTGMQPDDVNDERLATLSDLVRAALSG